MSAASASPLPPLGGPAQEAIAQRGKSVSPGSKEVSDIWTTTSAGTFSRFQNAKRATQSAPSSDRPLIVQYHPHCPRLLITLAQASHRCRLRLAMSRLGALSDLRVDPLSLPRSSSTMAVLNCQPQQRFHHRPEASTQTRIPH